jgi:phosphoribosylamine--glycine ligase
MGAYKDVDNWLPFLTKSDWLKECEIANRLFEGLKGAGANPGLRGVPFYLAFIHTRKGIKILENNSRPGDPEIQNLLPILKDDFVEICLRMIDRTLKRVKFERQATVVTYKVPPTYGGKLEKFTGDRRVNLSNAINLSKQFNGKMKIYPGALELRNGEIYTLKSRAVCVVGVGDDLPSARETSLKGITAITGGSLWNRMDIASKEHIEKSIIHMKKLRH